MKGVPHEKHIVGLQAWRYNYPDADAAAKAYPLPVGFLEGKQLSESEINSQNIGRSSRAYEEQTGRQAKASDVAGFRAAIAPLVAEARRAGKEFSAKLLDLVGAQGGEHSVVLLPGRVLKFTEPDSAGAVVKIGTDGEPNVFPGTAVEYIRQDCTTY